jgi:hypothetical protein
VRRRLARERPQWFTTNGSIAEFLIVMAVTDRGRAAAPPGVDGSSTRGVCAADATGDTGTLVQHRRARQQAAPVVARERLGERRRVATSSVGDQGAVVEGHRRSGSRRTQTKCHPLGAGRLGPGSACRRIRRLPSAGHRAGSIPNSVRQVEQNVGLSPLLAV